MRQRYTKLFKNYMGTKNLALWTIFWRGFWSCEVPECLQKSGQIFLCTNILWKQDFIDILYLVSKVSPSNDCPAVCCIMTVGNSWYFSTFLLLFGCEIKWWKCCDRAQEASRRCKQKCPWQLWRALTDSKMLYDGERYARILLSEIRSLTCTKFEHIPDYCLNSYRMIDHHTAE